MKIAFITPFLYRGGISKHSENIYNELKKIIKLMFLISNDNIQIFYFLVKPNI